MSAQHTPGTIRYDYEPGYCGELIASNGGTVATFADEPSEADARRLVACWNALIDLPQEALDGGWTRAGLEAHALKMQAQRDELLEALRSVHCWMENQADGQSKGGHATFDLLMLREQRDIAAAAIAKVEADK